MMTVSPARVRFAPSPTGITHLGNLRTALFNWLLARQSGGQFLLRIEDTDQQRRYAGAVQGLMDDMRWLGLDWDEGPDVGGPHGPYVQSERLAHYRAAAQVLLDGGHAYYCDCPPDRLDRLRRAQIKRGEMTRYDGHCRDRGLGPGDGHVIRFRMPQDGQTTVSDVLRGATSYDNAQLPDAVLMKSDGFPTYHLANVVDDHAMRITHVLRGDEWLNSLALHAHLYAAFGWEPPLYAHLPLIVDLDGRKLKKRPEDLPGVTDEYLEYAQLFRVETLRRRGYLPEAVLNYLALLGWNPGTEEELFTADDLIARFDLARVSPSPSRFDADRLNWFNRQHMARLDGLALLKRARPFLTAVYPDPRLAADAAPEDEVWAQGLVEIVRDEVATLGELPTRITWVFQDPAHIDSDAQATLRGPSARPVLTALLDALPAGREPVGMLWSNTTLRELMSRFKEVEGWGGRQVLQPIRAALTGTVHGPHLASLIALLDAPTIRRRITRVM